MVALHGEVKTKILQQILAHESFTAPELCEWAKLTPEQVYPYLAKLTATGFLTRKPIEYRERPPHRPFSSYHRTKDEAKLTELQRQAAVLIPPYPKPLSLQDMSAFSRAQQVLDRIDRWLHSCGIWLSQPMSLKRLGFLEKWIPRLEESLEQAQTDLKITYLDAAIPENSTDTNTTVVSHTRRIRRYQSELFAVKETIQVRIAELRSEENFSTIIRTSIFGTINSLKDITRMVKENFVTVFQTLATQYAQSDDVRLKRSLSEFVAALSLTEPAPNPEIVPIVFATRLLRFGSDTQLAESIIKSHGPINDPVGLNVSANIAFLANQYDEARHSWCKSADILLQEGSQYAPIALRWKTQLETGILSTYKHTLVAVGNSSNLELQNLKTLEDKLGLYGTVSIISARQIAGIRTDAFAVKALLSDYFDADTNSCELSRSVSAKVRPLFTYGPITERIGFPGLPALRVGLALVSLGYSPERAWNLATSMTTGRSLLLLHRKELWDKAAVGEISKMVPETFELQAVLSDQAAMATYP